MPPAFDIVDDDILPHGGSYDTMTPRESNVRNAMVVMTIAAPFIGSFVIWLYAWRPTSSKEVKKAWRVSSFWNFDVLVMLWFWSVTIIGVLFYVQKGHTNRLTYIFAILHTQLEVLMSALLLRFSFGKALICASLWGVILHLSALALQNMSLVFSAVSILGGGNDALIFLILLYGKKWLYSIGAFFHLASAVLVFTGSAIFIDVVKYNSLMFIFLWPFVGFMTAAIIHNTPSEFGGARNGYIQLSSSSIQASPQLDSSLVNGQEDQDQGSRNPMKDVDIPPSTLILMIGASLIGSTAITVTLYNLA